MKLFRQGNHLRRALPPLLVVAVAIGSWLFYEETTGPMSASSSGSEQTELASDARAQLPALPESRFLPVAADEAITLNQQLPFSKAPIEPAQPLFMEVHPEVPGMGLDAANCLTAAIYYEGANESVQGRKAIAQVVINRARHPAFPNSICSVVYQGSERKTGCQFTFTCDGSLRRKPSTSGWNAARQIALAALQGATEPSVGMATHYHANYVVPYWAESLDKIVQVGTHIFYRWRGGWGRRAVFTQAVTTDTLPALEPEVASLFDFQMMDSADYEPPAVAAEEVNPHRTFLRSDQEVSRLKLDVDTGMAEPVAQQAPPPPPQLEADRTQGRLLIDEE